ncbi:MAG: response regulator, partial [Planctomycetaceae bacterium]|nr:response regulator [Planctomycetaceae bacterium]
QQQKRDRNHLATRAAVAKILQEQRPLKQRLQESLALLVNLEGLENQNKAGIFLTFEEQDHLDLIVTHGDFPQHFLENEQSIPKGFCLCGKAAISGELIISNGCLKDPRHDQTYQGMTSHGHYIVPLVDGDVTVGVMFLYADPYPNQDKVRIEQLKVIGKLIGVAIANDRLQQQLESEKERAENSNRAKSQFLANMSHEIRTPLNGVIGFVEILLSMDSQLEEEERREFLSCIQSSGKHLLKIINDILDLTKIETDKVELEYMEFSFHSMIADVMSLLRVDAQEKGLKFEFEWSGPLPKTINTDPTRLRQLLVNLVGNAIKFTEQGEVLLAAHIAQTGNKDLLVIEVKDTGPGIPEDQLESIFAAFMQSDNSVTRQFGGTGLGLSISRQLARAMGGDVTVQSKLGQGSTFTASIEMASLEQTELLDPPSADGYLGSEQSTNEPEEVDEQSQVLSPGTRVLLVEDGELNSKLVVAILSKADIDYITLAENGEIGLQRACEKEYDVILMDMQMPIMDGYTATRKLRALGIKTPIIALTANAMKGDQQKCIDAGCDDYLSKPISKSALFKKLSTLQPHHKQAESTSKKTYSPGHSCEEASGEIIQTTLPIHNAVFLEIAQNFVELLKQSLQELYNAVENQDRTRIKQISFNLSDTAGGAGFGAFINPSQYLVSIADLGTFEEIAQIVEQLNELSDQVCIPELSTAT